MHFNRISPNNPSKNPRDDPGRFISYIWVYCIPGICARYILGINLPVGIFHEIHRPSSWGSIPRGRPGRARCGAHGAAALGRVRHPGGSSGGLHDVGWMRGFMGKWWFNDGTYRESEWLSGGFLSQWQDPNFIMEIHAKSHENEWMIYDGWWHDGFWGFREWGTPKNWMVYHGKSHL